MRVLAFDGYCSSVFLAMMRNDTHLGLYFMQIFLCNETVWVSILTARLRLV